MTEVAQGVHRISKGVNAFVVDGDTGVTLIDTGLPNWDGLVARSLREIGRSLDDVTSILLTHAHVDHVGGAADLSKASNARVFASAADAPAIEGKAETPHPPMFKWVKPLSRLMPSADPASVDVLVEDGTMPDGIRAIPTPGHTDGHVCFLLDRGGGILFAGDAAVAKNGRIKKGFFNAFGGPPITESIATLGTYDFEVACFGHSGTLRSGASRAFADFEG